jgi:K+-sensing histidine kinase KdpD
MLDPGHSTAENGIGFGLYIDQDITSVHGWDVEFTESDSGGARCEITGVEVGSN